jgi:hypothetical protein
VFLSIASSNGSKGFESAGTYTVNGGKLARVSKSNGSKGFESAGTKYFGFIAVNLSVERLKRI